MPTFEQLIELAQLGAIPMLTFAVIHLWQRLNKVTDKLLEYLEDRADNGDVAAQRAILVQRDESAKK